MKKIKLSELIPSDYNPRLIDERSMSGLIESIKRFGLVQPIIVNKRSGNVVGGHQRLRALQKIGGYDNVDVIEVDLDQTEEKTLNIALNNQYIQGKFTNDLQDLLDELSTDTPEDYEKLLLDQLKDNDFNAHDEWNEMPEYNQQDTSEYKKIIVNFKDKESVDEFFRLIDQRHTDKTNSIWFPEMKQRVMIDKCYE